MKKQIIIALATLTALPAVSQEKWDLRKCIDYAIEHNLSIKQQEAARDQNAVDLNTAKYSRLPNQRTAFYSRLHYNKTVRKSGYDSVASGKIIS